jgi:hypothetical protein
MRRMNREKLLRQVERVFDDGRDCMDCPQCRTWREPRGEFWGVRCSEPMSECGALESRDPALCPALGWYANG